MTREEICKVFLCSDGGYDTAMPADLPSEIMREVAASVLVYVIKRGVSAESVCETARKLVMVSSTEEVGTPQAIYGPTDN